MRAAQASGAATHLPRPGPGPGPVRIGAQGVPAELLQITHDCDPASLQAAAESGQSVDMALV